MPAYPAFGLAKQEQKASAVSGRRRSPSTVLECLHRGSLLMIVLFYNEDVTNSCHYKGGLI